MTPLRVLVVDDEAPARRRLRRLLDSVPAVTVVGEAGDGEGAIAQAEALRPDVVLLDIQMPEPSGIDVVARFSRPRPYVIFVTAFDRFAVRAFELHALDYLLKPVSRVRLAEALARVRTAPPPVPEATLEAWDRWARPGRPLRRIAVKATGRVDLVDVAAIDWIEAADNYVVIHTGDRQHLLRETLSRLAGRLDPSRFMRVHRSAVVAIDAVVRLDPQARGDWVAILRGGGHAPVSRTYRAALFARVRPT